MHSNGYSFHCLLMRSLTGDEMDLDAKNSQEERVVGLMMPRPPSLGGRPRRSHSRSFGGDLPVREGISFVLMQVSSGRR